VDADSSDGACVDAHLVAARLAVAGGKQVIVGLFQDLWNNLACASNGLDIGEVLLRCEVRRNGGGVRHDLRGPWLPVLYDEISMRPAKLRRSAR
jgi:hypothetical protein